jgi:hypothetical protein
VWQRQYSVGDSIPLSVLSTNASGTPTLPDSAPVAEIYDASGSQVGSDISLPIRDRYGADSAGTTNCYFGRTFRLNSSYAAGRYMILYKWIISSVTYKATDHFDIAYAGDADGCVIGMGAYATPLGFAVAYDTESGKTLRGLNPH